MSAARRSNQQLTANIEHADERLQHAKDHLQDLIRLLDSIPDFWPTHSTLVTSGFGVRADPFTGRTAFHYGLDIAGETGDAVYAAADGIIVAAGMDRSRGRYLIIEHERSVRTVYMHLQRLLVQEGDEVIKGEEIARLGSTGRSTGPHLHFEVIEHGRNVNPLLYLQRKTEP